MRGRVALAAEAVFSAFWQSLFPCNLKSSERRDKLFWVMQEKEEKKKKAFIWSELLKCSDLLSLWTWC